MKLLILRVSAIGDVIHTLPSISLLKTIDPSIQISWVVQEKAAALLKNQPFIENLWILPDKFLRPKNWKKTYAVLKEMAAIKWDAILDFQGIFKTSFLLSFLRGIKYGFDYNHARSGITALLTNKHVTPDYTNIIQKNLALASYVGADLLKAKASPTIETLIQNNNFITPYEQQQIVNTWLADNGITKYIIITPNTTWPSKHLPEENWKEFFIKLELNKEQFGKNIAIVLVGRDFGNQGKNLASFAEKERLNVFIAPRWDLVTTAHLIKNAHLLIAPDTGLLHLADFLGTTSIGIFGPTSAQKHGPFLRYQNKRNALQINCAHHYQKTHGATNQQNCMYTLTSEQLYAKVLENL